MAVVAEGVAHVAQFAPRVALAVAPNVNTLRLYDILYANLSTEAPSPVTR